MTFQIKVFFILIFSLLPVFCHANAGQCSLPSHSLLDPPIQNQPVLVKISNYVLDIESVDDQKQQFTSDFIVEYSWQDQCLGSWK